MLNGRKRQLTGSRISRIISVARVTDCMVSALTSAVTHTSSSGLSFFRFKKFCQHGNSLRIFNGHPHTLILVPTPPIQTRMVLMTSPKCIKLKYFIVVESLEQAFVTKHSPRFFFEAHPNEGIISTRTAHCLSIRCRLVPPEPNTRPAKFRIPEGSCWARYRALP